MGGGYSHVRIDSLGAAKTVYAKDYGCAKKCFFTPTRSYLLYINWIYLLHVSAYFIHKIYINIYIQYLYIAYILPSFILILSYLLFDLLIHLLKNL